MCSFITDNNVCVVPIKKKIKKKKKKKNVITYRDGSRISQIVTAIRLCSNLEDAGWFPWKFIR